jgi:DNA-binding beta-propeller fold protein YncE
VADNAERIQKFDLNGTFVAQTGTFGHEPGEFHKIQGLALDKAGRLYAADGGNYRIQVFDQQLKLLTTWSQMGAKPGQFNTPGGIALDPNGFIYVTDFQNDRIEKFSALNLDK